MGTLEKCEPAGSVADRRYARVCRLLNLGGSGDSGIRQTPEEMVNEMREKVKRFEEAADSAEERVQLARREANVRSEPTLVPF